MNFKYTGSLALLTCVIGCSSSNEAIPPKEDVPMPQGVAPTGAGGGAASKSSESVQSAPAP